MNALPGAVQRAPADQPTELSDVFSIANEKDYFSLDWTLRGSGFVS
jgi:hypothetical protein